MLRWLIFAQYMPILDARMDINESARALLAALKQLDIPCAPDFDAELISRELRFCRETPAEWDISTCRNARDFARFYHGVRWNYCAFLRNTKGFPWTRADFLADLLERFWEDRPTGKKPKDTFMLSEKHINEHIAKTCRDFFNVNGVHSFSLLESVWNFVEYLKFHSWIDEPKAESIHETCRRLFDLCLHAVDSTDPAPRLMPKFPVMPCPRR